MKTIVVTGGSGKAGRAVITDLLAHGYNVLNIDSAPPRDDAPPCPYTAADLTDFGQAIESLMAIDNRTPRTSPAARPDAVVHLAAIPAAGRHTNAHTFKVNTTSTYNIFEAARQLGIKNVVWASSETVLGLPFDVPPPYVPIDENFPPLPESAYSLSKHLGEAMADQFCRWDPTLKVISLRFSNIMEAHDYARFDSWQQDPKVRKWNLWGYIDARDAAQSVRLSLQAKLTGHHAFIIANDDTTMTADNNDLLAKVFPTAPKKRPIQPRETLLAIEKARKVLGYKPQHNWKPL